MQLTQLRAMSPRRVYVKNLRYSVTKNALRNVIQRIGCGSCSSIALVRKDQCHRPTHCSAFLVIEQATYDVSCAVVLVYIDCFNMDILHGLKNKKVTSIFNFGIGSG